MAYKLINKRARGEGDDGPEEVEKVLEFELLPPWPKKYFGQSFGPSLIHKAMEAGFYVLARIAEAPKEVRAYEARWSDGALQIRCGEGWRFPLSLRTVSPADLRGIKL